MNLTSPRRSTPNDDENPVPVELPHVLVIVAADGTLTATVDGRPFRHPVRPLGRERRSGRSWMRSPRTEPSRCGWSA